MREKIKFLAYFLFWATIAFVLVNWTQTLLIHLVSLLLPFFLGLAGYRTEVITVTDQGMLIVRQFAGSASRQIDIEAGSIVINLVPLLGLFLATFWRGWIRRLISLAIALPVMLIFDGLALFMVAFYYESEIGSLEPVKVFLNGVGLAMVPLLLWALLLQPMNKK